MAHDKKSFILYADILHTVRQLTKEEAGELFIHILSYVNDENPVTDNKFIAIAFEPIKQQLKRDLKHWESTKEKRSKAGQASAESRKHNLTNSTHVNICQQEPTNSTVNDNVNVNVNVNDNVILKSTNRRFTPPTHEDVILYAEETGKGSRAAPGEFHDYYTSNGWKVGKNGMKDWRAAYRKWVTNEKKYNETNQRTNPNAETPQQRKERIYRESGSTIGRGGEFFDIFAIPHDSK